MSINTHDYILPLVTGKKIDDNTVDGLHRYAGMAFYIGHNGLVATCAHIVESLANDEILMVKDLNLNAFLEIEEIKCHPSMDFSIGRIKVNNNRYPIPANVKVTQSSKGLDLWSLGYVNMGKEENNVILQPRFFKGYISSFGDKPHPQTRSKSHCEISFPSLAGFSGAPVFLSGTNRLVGMLFGNNESSIEVFSFQEITEDKKNYSEKIFRTIEFGLIHTVNDIVSYLEDLNMKAFQ
jgi:hypothetical protein